MVLLGRAMVRSHRLSIKTTVVADTIWVQFAMQVLTGGYEPPVCEEGVVVGVGDGSPE